MLRPGEYVLRPREVRLLPGAARAVKQLNSLGYLVIIITNQGVVGRGILKKEKLNRIHALLIHRLRRQGAVVDAVYYCPHHPRAVLPGYAIRCRCRKPNIGMILKAARDFRIDIKKSFLIGDTTQDILTGKRAGLKTILVKTGYAGEDGKHKTVPDFVAKNLKEAVFIIRKAG
jgi:mannose-1-phosphate guanylyltransferase/phosphomannomutase